MCFNVLTLCLCNCVYMAESSRPDDSDLAEPPFKPPALPFRADLHAGSEAGPDLNTFKWV